LGLSLNFK